MGVEAHAVAFGHAHGEAGVPVRQVGVGAEGLDARAAEEMVHAGGGDAPLLPLVAPPGHACSTAPALIRLAPLEGRVRRARHPWDRFYRHHVAPWRGERDLRRLAPWLGGRVLELGVGNGKGLRPLLRAGHDAIGLDVSFHALRRLDGPCVLGDAARLPFRDGAFDVVLDIHCGGHLGPVGRRHAAAEAARCVRPGGHVVVERLMPDDLRAGQGAPVDGDPAARAVQDGRTTWFADHAAIEDLYELEPVACLRHRHAFRARGQAAVRATATVVFRRPD